MKKEKTMKKTTKKAITFKELDRLWKNCDWKGIQKRILEKSSEADAYREARAKSKATAGHIVFI